MAKSTERQEYRCRPRSVAAAIVVAVCLCTGACKTLPGIRSSVPGPRFHVVEAGHSTPDTQYFAQHWRDMERRGHNGVALGVAWPRADGGTLGVAARASSDSSLNWRTFMREPITDNMIAGALADLESVRSDHFDSNLILVVPTPGGPAFHGSPTTMNWFDDDWWRTICGNARQVARLAKNGGCLGILFDPEEYGYHMWDYDVLRTAPPVSAKTYKQVLDQARHRGREYAAALCDVYPDITFWTFFAWSWELVRADNAREAGREPPRLLLSAFCDGMLEGSSADFVLVDGLESAYYWTTRNEFERGADLVRQRGRELSTVPELYAQKVRVGFGLYLDARGLKHYHWYREDWARNYWTPGRLQRAIYWALRAGDGYVWTWSEKPVWWVDGPRAEPLPPARKPRADQCGVPQVYWDAVRNAFREPGPDRTLPADQAVDPDPRLARFLRFEVADDASLYEPVPIPARFRLLATLPRDGWSLRTDPFEEGLEGEWYRSATPVDDWRPIRIGAWYEQQGVDFDGTAWYRRDVTVPKLPAGKRIYLFFGAVDESLWCYVDGELVAWHDGDPNRIWKQPFALDVTGQLPSVKTCTLVFRTLDRGRMGGIWKDVSIVAEK